MASDSTTSQTETPGERGTTAPAPRPRRRVLRVAIALLVVLAAVALIGPLVAAPMVRAAAVDGLEQRLVVDARLGELAFDLGGSASLGGLQLDDEQGRRLLELDRAAVDVELGALLSGRYAATVDVSGLRAHIHLDEQGRFDWQSLLRDFDLDADADDEEEDDDQSADDAETLPELALRLDVNDVDLVVHAPDGVTQINALSLRVDVPDLAQTCDLSLGFDLLGPDGAAGRVEVDGEILLAPRGVVDPQTLTGTLGYVVDDVMLQGFAPILSAVMPGWSADGRVEGEGRYELAERLALSGGGRLTVHDVRVLPADLEGTLKLNELSLQTSVVLDETASGTHQVRVELDDAVSVTWNGTTREPLEDGGTANGLLYVAGDVLELSELASPWVSVRDGLQFLGSFTSSVELDLTRGPEGPRDGSLEVLVDVEGLRGRLAEGGFVDLGSLSRFRLDMDSLFDLEAGRAQVERLELSAGTVVASGSGAVSGLPAPGAELQLDQVSVHDARFSGGADLDRLAADLAAVVDTSDWSLGGRLDAALAADSTDEGLLGALRIEGAGLRLGGDGIDFALDTLTVDQVLRPEGERLTWLGELGLESLRWTGSDGAPFVLDGATVTNDGVLDLAAGALDLREVTLSAPGLGLSARVQGTASKDPNTADAPVRADLNVALTLSPGAVSQGLAAQLGGLALSGAPLGGSIDLSVDGQQYGARGRFLSDELIVSLPGEAGAAATVLGQRDVECEFDVAADMGSDAGSVRIERLRAASRTVDALLTGLVSNLDSSAPDAELQLALDADLPHLVSDVRALLPASVDLRSGRLVSRSRISGGGANWALDGTTRLDDIDVRLPPPELEGEGPPQAPTTLVEPSLVLSYAVAAQVPVAPTDPVSQPSPTAGPLIEIDHVDLQSTWVDGRLGGRVQGGESWACQGLRGEFTYVPAQLGALLSPWLPGALSGDEPQSVVLAFDGAVPAGGDVDVLALLGQAVLTIDAGLGRYRAPMIDVGGNLHVDVRDQRAGFSGRLEANGGTLGLDLDLGLDPLGPEPSTLSLELADLGLHAEMQELLSFVHPAFTSIGAKVGGAFAGRADGTFEVVLDTALVSQLLAGDLFGGAALGDGAPGGAAGADLASALASGMSASGTFDMDDVVLSATDLLKDLLDRFDVSDSREIDFQPLSLVIDDGRLSYAAPWVWQFGTTQTNFTGSVGFDRTLDLAWNLPVTERLADKYRVLEPLLGDLISVPLTGTVDAPQLQWNQLLATLPADIIEKAIRDPIDQIIGNTDEDPAELLRIADQLWIEGEVDQARQIYRRLEDEFKFTLVFLLNKKHIERRAEEPKPPKPKDGSGAKGGKKKDGKKKKGKGGG